MDRIIAPLGRLFLSVIFLMRGMKKIFDWSGTAVYMSSIGMITVPFFLIMAIVFELAVDPRPGAWPRARVRKNDGLRLLASSPVIIALSTSHEKPGAPVAAVKKIPRYC